MLYIAYIIRYYATQHVYMHWTYIYIYTCIYHLQKISGIAEYMYNVYDLIWLWFNDAWNIEFSTSADLKLWHPQMQMSEIYAWVFTELFFQTFLIS